MESFSEEEISIKDIILKSIDWFHFFKAKWIIITIVTFLGVLAGLFYSFFEKPEYTAKLTFALEEKSSSGNGIGAIASQFGLNLGGSEGGAFAGDNIIELMKSRLIIEKTLLTKTQINGKDDLLVNRYILFHNYTTKSNFFLNNDRNNFTRDKDSLLGMIYLSILNNSLEVAKIDKKLSIISVKIKSKDEYFAKEFCENLVSNVTDFYIETKVGKSKNNVQMLESRVDSVKEELDKALYGRAYFSDQNNGLIRQSAAVPKIKQEMKVQMLGTMYGELIKNLEFSKLALMREEPLIQIIDRPILPINYNKIGKIKAMLIGGIIFSVLSLLLLFLSRLLSQIMN